MPPKHDKNLYWEIITRQKGILNKKEQLILKNSKVTVIGCGGIGGAAIEMLARMGVENLKIVDKDVFDVSNINRQLMSSINCIGQPKTQVTEEILHSINPCMKIEALNQELNQENVEEILKGSDLVVDALDNLVTRILLSRHARKLNIPFIHGAIHGFMGQITTFSKETPSYEELFKLPSHGKDLNDEIISQVMKLNQQVPPVIAPVPNIVGCLQSFEVVKHLTHNGKPIMAPEVLMFDLMKNEPFYTVKY